MSKPINKYSYLCIVIKKYILLFIFIFLCFISKAQTSPHYILGAEEFSNTDVYTLYYDDQTDVLYAGTNRGVYAYKQNKFTALISNKKQIGNSFFQLKKDKIGRLFCSNLAGQVFEIKENKLLLFYQTPRKDFIFNFRYYFDNENNLIVNTKLRIRKITKKSDSIILNIPASKTHDSFIPMSTQLLDGSIFYNLARSSFYFSYDNGKLSKLKLPNSNYKNGFNFFELENVKLYNSSSIKRIDGTPLKKTINISPKSSVHQLNQNEIAVRDSELGLYYIAFENGELKRTPSSFKNTFISTITQNENNTTFLGTFKEGVIVIPNKKNIKQSIKNHLTGITSSANNAVFLSDKKGNVFKHNNGLEKYFQNKYNVDNLFFLEGEYKIEQKKIDSIINKDIKVKGDFFFNQNIKDAEEHKNEFVFLISPFLIQIIVADTNLKISPSFAIKKTSSLYHINIDSRGKSITYLKKDKYLYYATNINVYAKKWNSPEAEIIKFKGDRILGNDLINYDNQLIIGTNKNGILFYEKNTYQRQITTQQGLNSNTILKLKITNKLLFILTTKGIQVYDLNKNKFIGLGEREGVVSDKVTNFSLSKDKLWLLDNEGYYSFNLNEIKTKSKLNLGQVYLDSILVNHQKIKSTTSNFTVDENNFQIFFDYRDIETKSEAKIQYKLIGVSNQWITVGSNVNKIEFLSLSPGKYTLALKASYRNIETEPIEYHFEISQPVWFQLWFILLSFILIVLLVSMLFIYQIKKKDKKRKIESKTQKMQTAIFESKLKAIRSQMNPHFIFNSLNSIQALVLKKESRKSYDYIEMFSDLVRKTLMFSEKEYIPINEEINFLNIYLDLEALRMKSEFTFCIENKSNKEILIPSLLIQPFLENAIHHGLLHKKGSKNLLVSFNCKDEIAFCSITDNGVGRERANEINNRQKYSHESFSLNAMESRLQILSEQNNKQFDYIIEDLYTSSGKASGTKVTVNFPYKYKY